MSLFLQQRIKRAIGQRLDAVALWPVDNRVLPEFYTPAEREAVRRCWSG